MIDHRYYAKVVCCGRDWLLYLRKLLWHMLYEVEMRFDNLAHRSRVLTSCIDNVLFETTTLYKRHNKINNNAARK